LRTWSSLSSRIRTATGEAPRLSPLAAPSSHVALAGTEATTGESAPWMREKNRSSFWGDLHFGFEAWELNMVFYSTSATHRERGLVNCLFFIQFACMESMDNSIFFLLSKFHVARFLSGVATTSVEGLKPACNGIVGMYTQCLLSLNGLY